MQLSSSCTALYSSSGPPTMKVSLPMLAAPTPKQQQQQRRLRLAGCTQLTESFTTLILKKLGLCLKPYYFFLNIIYRFRTTYDPIYTPSFTSISKQENAKPHNASITTACLCSRRVWVLNWSACSPDLSLMENIWSTTIKQNIQKKNQTGVLNS